MEQTKTRKTQQDSTNKQEQSRTIKSRQEQPKIIKNNQTLSNRANKKTQDSTRLNNNQE